MTEGIQRFAVHVPNLQFVALPSGQVCHYTHTQLLLLHLAFRFHEKCCCVMRFILQSVTNRANTIMWQWHNRLPFRGRKQRWILKLKAQPLLLLNQTVYTLQQSKWETLLAGAQSNQTRYNSSNNLPNQLTDTCQGLFTSLIETLGVKDTQFEELISLDPDTIRSLG